MSDYLELRTQAHLMDAEFSSDDKPTEDKIKALILERGYDSSNIDIWFDDLMKFWRCSADIVKAVG